MRIGVNLLPMRPGKVGGAEVYVRALLGEMMASSRDHHFVLVTADDNHDTLRYPHPNHARRLLLRRASPAAERAGAALGRLGPLAAPARTVGAWLRGHTPRNLRDLIRAESLDLWFCPFTNLDPRPLSIPAVITVYDLQHETYPEFFAPEELAARNRFYPESCRAAERILAISEFTREEVVARYGVSPARVVTTHLFAGPGYDAPILPGDLARVRSRHRLPARYLFYPAHTWHHKNHALLLEAFARYRSRSGGDVALVLTGEDFEARPRLEACLDRLAVRPHVRFLGSVEPLDLPALFAGAAALVFPSLFEGFGIPLVEAMLAGCPIAAARATSVPEVVGEAALLFDPTDPEEAATAIHRLLNEPVLAAELVRRGRVRARAFSPGINAGLTLSAFAAAAGDQAPTAPAVEEEGVFADRWIQDSARFRVLGRNGGRPLTLEGEVPNIEPLLPLSLEVWVDGRRRPPHVVERAGPFRLCVELGDGASHEILLRPRRTFCPRRLGLSDDARLLSLRIHRAYLESAGEDRP